MCYSYSHDSFWVLAVINMIVLDEYETGLNPLQSQSTDKMPPE